MSTSKTARLLTGDGGTGKTSQLALYFDWVWRKHKKRSRLYTADGGGYGNKMENLVKLGIVEDWRLRTRFGAGGEDLIEETFQRASLGWWPKTFHQPGETRAGTELDPPATVTYILSCNKGHKVKEGGSQAALAGAILCKECKLPVTLQNGVVEKTSHLAAHMEGLGCIGFEGLTSWSDIQLNSLRDHRSNGHLQNEKSSFGTFQSGGMKFSGSSMGDYNFAQGEAAKWVQNSTTIPGLVVDPIWTALESQTDETGKRISVWAPSIAGSAKSAQVPQWFGDWLGLQKVPNDKGVVEWRMYLSEFRGEDGAPHRYKPRAEPGFLPAFLVDEGGKAFTGCNLGSYMDLLEDATEAGFKKAAEMYPDAPIFTRITRASDPGPGAIERETVAQPMVAPAAAVPPRPMPPRPAMPPPRPPSKPPAIPPPVGRK